MNTSHSFNVKNHRNLTMLVDFYEFTMIKWISKQ